MKLKIPEKAVLKAIKDYLQLLENSGRIAWFGRFQSGAYPVQHGSKTSYVRAGRPGDPDLIVCFNGKFVALEVKGSHGATTDEQDAVGSRIMRGGGWYAIVRSVYDVENILSESRAELAARGLK